MPMALNQANQLLQSSGNKQEIMFAVNLVHIFGLSVLEIDIQIVASLLQMRSKFFLIEDFVWIIRVILKYTLGCFSIHYQVLCCKNR